MTAHLLLAPRLKQIIILVDAYMHEETTPKRGPSPMFAFAYVLISKLSTFEALK